MKFDFLEGVGVLLSCLNQLPQRSFCEEDVGISTANELNERGLGLLVSVMPFIRAKFGTPWKHVFERHRIIVRKTRNALCHHLLPGVDQR